MGKTIATGSWDRSVKLWNRSGQLLQTLSGHSNDVTGVVFSPDGKTIASASLDKTVKLWNLSGELLQTLSGSSPVGGLVFSPDGKTIATASFDKIILWNRSGQLRDFQEIKYTVFVGEGCRGDSWERRDILDSCWKS